MNEALSCSACGWGVTLPEDPSAQKEVRDRGESHVFFVHGGAPHVQISTLPYTPSETHSGVDTAPSAAQE
jgi:hypothetical protein